MIEKYKNRDSSDLPHGRVVVEAFITYFKSKYDQDIKRGKTRKLSYLSTVQTSLSNYKKDLRGMNAPEKFLQQLHLTRRDTVTLIEEKKNNVRVKAIDLPAVQGDKIIKDCRELLHHENAYLQVMALACVTGRRMAEILFSADFHPPSEVHYTDERYWCVVTGILKKGELPPERREIPLLAPRDLVNKVLASVRVKLPAESVKSVNKDYARPIARVMKRYCAEMGNLHQFRKFYALACYKYFNERHCSLPRLAADYLCHKTMSDSILTYLNFRLEGLGSLDFGRGKKQPDVSHKTKQEIAGRHQKKSLAHKMARKSRDL